MNTSDIANTLSTLLSELIEGASEAGGYMLNPGDEGLLRSLDRISAGEASALTVTGSSIAAHTDHLRYGLSLMNRWAGGEANPFQDADWSASWRRTSVSDAEWQQLRAATGSEARRWLEAIRQPREADAIALNGMIGSIAHLAYHLGAIRQINQSTRGPRDGSN
jgi:hypothetical protein